MRCSVFCLGAGLILAVAGCESQPIEGLEPLAPTTDLTKQTVAKATCTRGNSPVVMTVGRDGAADGRVVGGRGNFSGSLVAVDPKTVLFSISEGATDNEQLGERLTIAAEGGEIVLRGGRFVCTDVSVRSAG